MEQQNLEDEVYAFIRAYMREHSHPPTLREIGANLHMSYPNVIRYLDKLEAHGRITRRPGKSRGITLLDSRHDS